MKRKPLLTLLLLPLTACIPVEDFGDYWAKAGKDRKLAGTWRVVAGENIGASRQFVDAGDYYTHSGLNAEGKPIRVPEDQAEVLEVKTMAIGRYTFLFFSTAEPTPAGKRKGVIYRYKIDADNLELIENFGPNLGRFVTKNYPRAVNIKRNKGEGEYAVIDTFDDQVAKIISAIPDTEEYWENWEQLVRVR
jgi:hypothetical protein